MVCGFESRHRHQKKARLGVLFSMKFVPCGTSEILLRNMKYASRMKYASGIWRNELYFIFGTSRIFHNPQGLFHICRKANISLNPVILNRVSGEESRGQNAPRSRTGFLAAFRIAQWLSTLSRAFFNEIHLTAGDKNKYFPSFSFYDTISQNL